MKASEAISGLQAILKEHGDVDVWFFYFGYDGEEDTNEQAEVSSVVFEDGVALFKSF